MIVADQQSPWQVKQQIQFTLEWTNSRLTKKSKRTKSLRIMASTSTAGNQKTAIQKQIEELQNRLKELDQEAVHELKLRLSDARKVVTTLEEELEQLTGKPSEPKVRVRRERRPSITDDALKDQILKVMANFGQEGMNAKQLADKLHQDPLRVRKFIKDNPKVLKRTGSGPGTRFYLP
jgi:hypothetical protein